MQVTSLLSYWPLDEILVECRDLGGFTFNKRFLLKFRKFPMERHSPVEQIRLKPPLNCTRKQDTWERYRGQQFLSNGKGQFGPTGRAGQSWPPSKARSQIFRWNGTEMVRYIWFLTKMHHWTSKGIIFMIQYYGRSMKLLKYCTCASYTLCTRYDLIYHHRIDEESSSRYIDSFYFDISNPTVFRKRVFLVLLFLFIYFHFFAGLCFRVYARL